MDCSLSGSSLHGISQARILEWFAISCSRGSFQPRDWTCVSCLAGGLFTTEPPGKLSSHFYFFKLSLPLKSLYLDIYSATRYQFYWLDVGRSTACHPEYCLPQRLHHQCQLNENRNGKCFPHTRSSQTDQEKWDWRSVDTDFLPRVMRNFGSSQWWY